jgi:hypothetical protein
MPACPTLKRYERYLFGWVAVLDALEVPLVDRAQARRLLQKLNRHCAGPIAFGTNGKRPFADRIKLFRWWDGMEKLYRLHLARLRDAR